MVLDVLLMVQDIVFASSTQTKYSDVFTVGKSSPDYIDWIDKVVNWEYLEIRGYIWDSFVL